MLFTWVGYSYLPGWIIVIDLLFTQVGVCCLPRWVSVIYLGHLSLGPWSVRSVCSRVIAVNTAILVVPCSAPLLRETARSCTAKRSTLACHTFMYFHA